MTPPLGSPTLMLVPTELELSRLEDQGGFERGSCLRSLCGFGVVAAAARTAQLLAELRPARVLLVGIAGTYDEERYPVESACDFDAVSLYGVGAGEGEAFLGPPALGFPQWPGSPGTTPHPVVDTLPLARRPSGPPSTLLTPCAAAADDTEAARRRALFPEAVGEDMEGFAVTLACALSDTPVRIVRGFSNRVGDRAPENWRIPAALAAARERALELLAPGTAWE